MAQTGSLNNSKISAILPTPDMHQIPLTDDISIGGDAPPFLIAEIGINHNGDPVLSDEMIAAAAEAGAHCVKFQNYLTEDFVADRNQQYSYLSAGQEVTESMFEMFKRYEVDREFLAHAKATCDKYGVIFTSTPTNKNGIRDLTDLGAPILKNGSDYLTNLEVVRQLGESGLPTIISCGMSTLADIDEAARTFHDTGNKDLILLHCTSCYPTPAKEANLRKITSLMQAFDVPVGLSDHTEGALAATLSTMLGANVIEKHFTTDRNLPGPDQRFSSDPEEFAQLARDIQAASLLLGSGKIGPTIGEATSRAEFRLSCVAIRDLPAGHLLQEEDLTFKRPGTGIPPNAAQYFIGRTTSRSISMNKLISQDDFRP